MTFVAARRVQILEDHILVVGVDAHLDGEATESLREPAGHGRRRTMSKSMLDLADEAAPSFVLEKVFTVKLPKTA